MLCKAPLHMASIDVNRTPVLWEGLPSPTFAVEKSTILTSGSKRPSDCIHDNVQTQLPTHRVSKKMKLNGHTIPIKRDSKSKSKVLRLITLSNVPAEQCVTDERDLFDRSDFKLVTVDVRQCEIIRRTILPLLNSHHYPIDMYRMEEMHVSENDRVPQKQLHALKSIIVKGTVPDIQRSSLDCIIKTTTDVDTLASNSVTDRGYVVMNTTVKSPYTRGAIWFSIREPLPLHETFTLANIRYDPVQFLSKISSDAWGILAFGNRRDHTLCWKKRQIRYTWVRSEVIGGAPSLFVASHGMILLWCALQRVEQVPLDLVSHTSIEFLELSRNRLANGSRLPLSIVPDELFFHFLGLGTDFKLSLDVLMRDGASNVTYWRPLCTSAGTTSFTSTGSELALDTFLFQSFCKPYDLLSPMHVIEDGATVIVPHVTALTISHSTDVVLSADDFCTPIESIKNATLSGCHGSGYKETHLHHAPLQQQNDTHIKNNDMNRHISNTPMDIDVIDHSFIPQGPMPCLQLPRHVSSLKAMAPTYQHISDKSTQNRAIIRANQTKEGTVELLRDSPAHLLACVSLLHGLEDLRFLRDNLARTHASRPLYHRLFTDPILTRTEIWRKAI
jgi:hypothetical protein